MRAQPCLTLCQPMDCSPPGFFVHGIFQGRILAWVASSYSRGSSQPKNWTGVSCISCIGRWIIWHWASWEAQSLYINKRKNWESFLPVSPWNQIHSLIYPCNTYLNLIVQCAGDINVSKTKQNSYLRKIIRQIREICSSKNDIIYVQGQLCLGLWWKNPWCQVSV